MLRQMLRLSFLPLVLTVVSLTACSNRLDVATVESTIQADIERQGRRLALREVRCPTDVPKQAGAFFRCVGELDPEGTFTINVTQQDDQGTVTWDVPNSKVMLNLVKVEEGLQQGLSESIGKQALVDCGEAVYRVNQPGDRFECRVVGGLTDGPDTINAILVKVDATGNLDWQELREAGSMATSATVAATAGTAPPLSPLGNTATRPSSQAGASTPATNADSPESAPPQAVQNTPTTGPTGRGINRPYIPGDND